MIAKFYYLISPMFTSNFHLNNLSIRQKCFVKNKDWTEHRKENVVLPIYNGTVASKQCDQIWREFRKKIKAFGQF